MKRMILAFSLLIFSFGSVFADVDYLSVAYCTSGVEKGVKSLEIFDNDEGKGLVVAEVSLEHGIVRLAKKIKVIVIADILKVSFGKETVTIKRYLAGDPNPPTFTLEGQQFTCHRVDW